METLRHLSETPLASHNPALRLLWIKYTHESLPSSAIGPGVTSHRASPEQERKARHSSSSVTASFGCRPASPSYRPVIITDTPGQHIWLATREQIAIGNWSKMVNERPLQG